MATGFQELKLKKGLKARYWDHRYTLELFKSQPIATEIDGTAASGATGATNILLAGRNIFEYHIKGAGQTILVPQLAAGGLDISLDQTSAEGVEITQGITARSPGAFTVGTDGPFFFSAKLDVEDVSGAAELAVGFRKAASFTANLDDYTDFAVLNAQAGTINIETALNNAATVTTDTTETWADGASHTLTVKVSRAGVVTYEVDGAAPGTVAAYTFDAGDVVVPVLFFLHGADVAGAVLLERWECGLGYRSTAPVG